MKNVAENRKKQFFPAESQKRTPYYTSSPFTGNDFSLLPSWSWHPISPTNIYIFWTILKKKNYWENYWVSEVVVFFHWVGKSRWSHRHIQMYTTKRIIFRLHNVSRLVKCMTSQMLRTFSTLNSINVVTHNQLQRRNMSFTCNIPTRFCLIGDLWGECRKNLSHFLSIISHE